MTATDVVALAAGFLIGSFPTAYLLVRWLTGTDIRDYGSGNAGATNVMRRCGPGWGALTLLVDLAKGAVAAVLAGALPGASEVSPVLAGLAAVLGHVYTPWLAGRGGKGVATSAGALAILAPAAAGGSFVLFVAAVLLTRRPAVGSLAGAAGFPILAAVFGSEREILLLGILLAVLIAWWHRDNIARLIRGEEPRVTGRREES